MAKSKNNKITKRGNHVQRVRSHDEYLIKTFPGFSNMTNPYSAVVAEMLDEEMSEFQPNKETIEAMKKAETDNLSRFNTTEDLFKELNSDVKVIEGEVLDATQELLISGTLGGLIQEEAIPIGFIPTVME